MVQANSLKKIIIICGPTASSKTSLAIECAKLLKLK
jgi:tRNA A37 N6-isopentenylltransferase MiaA